MHSPRSRFVAGSTVNGRLTQEQRRACTQLRATPCGHGPSPGLAASAEGCEITLDWLCSGSNTLYLCAPLGEREPRRRVFAALLHDLIAQAFEKHNRQGAPIDPRLLVLLDEAANTLRRIEVGDGLLLHGSLAPAWATDKLRRRP